MNNSRRPPRKGGRYRPQWFSIVAAYWEERIVTVTELELLLPSHRNQWLRPEIEQKLGALDLSVPLHQELYRLVKLSLELLESVDAGTYPKPRDWAEIEPWLRRALAYFVNGQDAIPDHFEDGYDDDYREFADLEMKLGPMLDHFDAWRLHRLSRGEAVG